MQRRELLSHRSMLDCRCQPHFACSQCWWEFVCQFDTNYVGACVRACVRAPCHNYVFISKMSRNSDKWFDSTSSRHEFVSTRLSESSSRMFGHAHTISALNHNSLLNQESPNAQTFDPIVNNNIGESERTGVYSNR